MKKIEEPRKMYVVVDSNNNWLSTYHIVTEKGIDFIKEEFLHEVACGEYENFNIGDEFHVFRISEELKFNY